MINLTEYLFSEVVPAGISVMVGDESRDGAENNGDHEKGEKDAETDSFAPVRFLREKIMKNPSHRDPHHKTQDSFGCTNRLQFCHCHHYDHHNHPHNHDNENHYVMFTLS